MNWLGTNSLGRFGNKIFAYFFLICCQRRLGVKCSTATWEGNDFFNLTLGNNREGGDRYVSINFETITDRSEGPDPLIDIVDKLIGVLKCRIEIQGAFQFHTRTFASLKELFIASFPFRDDKVESLQSKLPARLSNFENLVVVHYRAGDYLGIKGNPLLWSYDFRDLLLFVKQISTVAPDAFFYICSDSNDYIAKFRNEFPTQSISSYDFQLDIDDDARLFTDYYLQTNAKILIASNSSLSISSALLNQRARLFFRPSSRSGMFVNFDPWDTQVLLSSP